MSKDTKTPFNNPFAALAGAPSGASPSHASPGDASTAAQQKKPAARRAVLRREQKGHKETTRITHLAAHADEAVELAHRLKQKLGCGGGSEGCDIVLQGDQRERLKAVLPSLGVQRLTVA